MTIRRLAFDVVFCAALGLAAAIPGGFGASAAFAGDDLPPATAAVIEANAGSDPACDECRIETRCEPIYETVKVPIYGTRSVACTREVEVPVYATIEVPRYEERRVPVFERREVPLVGKRTYPVYEERRTPIVHVAQAPCLECREVPTFETRWVRDTQRELVPVYEKRKVPAYGLRDVPDEQVVLRSTWGTIDVPVRRRELEPVTECVEVPVTVHRVTTDVHVGCDECGCPTCEAQPPKAGSVTVGTRTEKRVVDVRAVPGEICGTRKVPVRTGEERTTEVVGTKKEWGTIGCREETVVSCYRIEESPGDYRPERVRTGTRCELHVKGTQLGAPRVVGHTTHKEAVGTACEPVPSGSTVKSVFVGWRVEKVYAGSEMREVQIGTRRVTVCDGHREERVQIGEKEEVRFVGTRKIEDHVGPAPKPACGCKDGPARASK